jgi:hypothetical protein
MSNRVNTKLRRGGGVSVVLRANASIQPNADLDALPNVIGGKADMARTCQYVRNDPKGTFMSGCGVWRDQGRFRVSNKDLLA